MRSTSPSEIILGVDIGTTRIKAAAIDSTGKIRASASCEAAPLGEWEGFVTFDAESNLKRVRAVVRDTASGLSKHRSPAALVFTTQRATIIPCDEGGIPLCPALSWQDTSGERDLAEFVDRELTGFSTSTGLPPSALWSLAKLLRLRRIRRDVFDRAACFVTVHDHALRRFGALEFVTDPSNASVTGLYDIVEREWHEGFAWLSGISVTRLPAVRPAGRQAGTLSAGAASAVGLPVGTPLLVGGGDQQCAAAGLGASEPGSASLGVGTAAVLCCPLTRPRPELAGKFFCTAHVQADRWLLEGIQNAFTSSFHWAASVLGFADATAFDRAARSSPPGARGVTFLPHLSGIGSPDFDGSATGAFIGLKKLHTSADMARAVYEGVLFETRRLLEAAGEGVADSLVVGGGFLTPARARWLADAVDREIRVSGIDEPALAGLAAFAHRALGHRGAVIGNGFRRFPPCHPEAWRAPYAVYLSRVADMRHPLYCPAANPRMGSRTR